MSKIEQSIDEIETYIEGCKTQAFSSKNIIVDKEQFEDLLSELRHSAPEEIKKCQKIISNQEAIINNAKAQADSLIASAQKQAEELVKESEIVRRANETAQNLLQEAAAQAQTLVNNASKEANTIQSGAISYTDGMLKQLEAIIRHSIDNSNSRQAAYVQSLQQIYDVVCSNRKELNPEEMIQPIDDETPMLPAADEM